jgi:IS5 family transposase
LVGDEPRAGAVRAVGTHCSPAAPSQAQQERRPAACTRQESVGSHRVRSAFRNPLGNVASEAVWDVRHDGLAAARRMDQVGGVEEASVRAPQRVGACRKDRFYARLHRRWQRSGSKKGRCTGPNPTDRAKAGSKHHLLVEAHGFPLAELLTAANVHDSRGLFPLVDAIPPVKGPRGRPRFRPKKLHGDKAYTGRRNRLLLRRRGIVPRIARPGIDRGTRLGRYRWVVERTLAWKSQFRRPRIRDDRRDDIHFGLLVLGCCIMLFRALDSRFC